MKILFDHQYFSTQKYGGITRYFAGLNEGLNKRPGIKSTIAALYSENAYLPKGLLPLNNVIGRKIFNGHTNRLFRWNKRYANYLIKQGNYDIFHPTYYDTYFLDIVRTPFVITVHDMIHEALPHFFPDATEVIARKKQLIEQAGTIIAISAYTKQQIINYYPQVEGKIKVVHHGYILNQTSASALILPAKYILFVGDRAFYKNFATFIKCIGSLLQHDKSLHLICAGGGLFTQEEKLIVTDFNISAQCRQLTVTDAQLKQLYIQATVFAFPSYQEGFGLPLLEAFANDCPVVCSNATCFPEIAGDAALYFDPMDGTSIKQAVAKVLNDDDIRRVLITKGKQRLQSFTFDSCVDNTIQVYKALIKSI
ncbi:glycosyltransferase involved in cell wall biosynthesis [Mucilaginibacter sp. UYP25]|uniref:glycosyltransferase family 4 protein n=1 Tax=unclassified Mucilaginibacter TaxID=2617802 RepID=UPI0033939599